MKYIIVLGNRNRDIMEKRVNRAIKELRSTPYVTFDPDTGVANYVTKLLFSGGSSDGVSKPEGAVMMKDYALTKGIEIECIHIEDKSRTTVENLIFCKEILEYSYRYNTVGWWRPEIVICTSSFHIKRATVLTKLILPLYTKISFIHTEEEVRNEEQNHEWSLLVNYINGMCISEIR
jgi:uncharacterized SAM-binding protein YcdF (DUF218 family)